MNIPTYIIVTLLMIVSGTILYLLNRISDLNNMRKALIKMCQVKGNEIGNLEFELAKVKAELHQEKMTLRKYPMTPGQPTRPEATVNIHGKPDAIKTLLLNTQDQKTLFEPFTVSRELRLEERILLLPNRFDFLEKELPWTACNMNDPLLKSLDWNWQTMGGVIENGGKTVYIKVQNATHTFYKMPIEYPIVGKIHTVYETKIDPCAIHLMLDEREIPRRVHIP